MDASLGRSSANMLFSAKIYLFFSRCYFGKISAQPHTKLCIQFLDRENNDKNNKFSLGKQIFIYNSMGLCGNFIDV